MQIKHRPTDRPFPSKQLIQKATATRLRGEDLDKETWYKVVGFLTTTEWMLSPAYSEWIESLPHLRWIHFQHTTSVLTGAYGAYRMNDTFCLFYYTLEGKGIFRDASGEHEIEPGTAFICKANDPNTAYYYPRGTSERWRFIQVAFGGTASLQFVDEIVHRFGHVLTINRSNSVLQQLLHFDERILRSQLLEYHEARNIVFNVMQMVADSVHLKEKAFSPIVKQAIILMEQQYQIPIGIFDIAANLDITREHLSGRFKRETGISPRMYLDNLRLTRAEHLLKASHLSCKQIAFKCGYEHYDTFLRAFSRKYGSSPMRFRYAAYVE